MRQQAPATEQNAKTLEGLFAEDRIALRRSALFDTSPPPPGDGYWDRAEGMMLGLAIGDALGNTSESLTPSARRRLFGEVRDYLPNRYAGGHSVGLPSDDTQLAFRCLEQMLADDGFMPENMAARFASCRIFGLGGTVRRFLENYASGAPWYTCGSSRAGNGALMRIAPMLLPHLEAPSPSLWVDTALSAMMTHNGAASTSGCLAFVNLLWQLVAGQVPEGGEWWLRQYLEVAEPLDNGPALTPRGGRYTYFSGLLSSYTRIVVEQAMQQDLSVRQVCDTWYSGAYLLETVPCVLYILMRHGDDPEEAIVRAVNDTKDNDTIAAIVGAAVGALHGKEALPGPWREGLLGRTAGDDDGRVFELLDMAGKRWSAHSHTRLM